MILILVLILVLLILVLILILLLILILVLLLVLILVLILVLTASTLVFHHQLGIDVILLCVHIVRTEKERLAESHDSALIVLFLESHVA